jgi:hypothetical protein
MTRAFVFTARASTKDSVDLLKGGTVPPDRYIDFTSLVVFTGTNYKFSLGNVSTFVKGWWLNFVPFFTNGIVDLPAASYGAPANAEPEVHGTNSYQAHAGFAEFNE